MQESKVRWCDFLETKYHRNIENLQREFPAIKWDATVIKINYI